MRDFFFTLAQRAFTAFRAASVRSFWVRFFAVALPPCFPNSAKYSRISSCVGIDRKLPRFAPAGQYLLLTYAGAENRIVPVKRLQADRVLEHPISPNQNQPGWRPKLATQNLPSSASSLFPQRRTCTQLGFNHNPEPDLLQKVRSKAADHKLPLEDFIHSCIAVTDRNLKFTWHDQEEFLYGAL